MSVDATTSADRAAGRRQDQPQASGRERSNLLGWLLPLGLCLLPCLVMYPLWSSPTAAGEDDVGYYFPLRKLVGQQLAQGRLPLENPLEATGHVLMSDPQAAVMYPPTWLFAFIDAGLAYSLSIFLGFAIAGSGMWAYLGMLRLATPARAVGTLALMFCGFMVGHRVHLSMLHTAAWLCWGLWCIETLLDRPLRAALAAPAIMLMALTAGHWPTLVHMSIILGAYFLFRARPLARSAAIMLAGGLLAAVVAAPQLEATLDLMSQATRQRVGFLTAGENSFFPSSAVHAFLPMIMGSRTPGFYGQQWWGVWHLCEMLGYVGLATLGLSMAAWRVRGVWRKRTRALLPSVLDEPGRSTLARSQEAMQSDAAAAVRAWSWIAAGAFVFMLGYYLPTYRLVHALPVLGVVRCPARMLLAVDAALATMAAAAVHWALVHRDDPTVRRVIKGSLLIVLPLAMVVISGAALLLADAMMSLWPGLLPFVGGPGELSAALSLTNPALWVPLITLGATMAAGAWWLGNPARRSWLLAAVLLADLSMVAAFVDMPGKLAQQDPQASPASQWLLTNDPPQLDQHGQPSYRVWGISESYCQRPSELMLAKTANSQGFSTISNYGPFQNPLHQRLFGFRIFGYGRDTDRLLRENHLLSLYGVKYVIVADGQTRRIIESVTLKDALLSDDLGSVEPGLAPRPAPDNVQTLYGGWAGRWIWMSLQGQDQLPALFAGSAGDSHLPMRIELQTWQPWNDARARHDVSLRPWHQYRLAFFARATEGAGDSLWIDIVSWNNVIPPQRLEPVDAGEMHEQWRLFECRFVPDAQFAAIRLSTRSETSIEITGACLIEGPLSGPVTLADGPLKVGQRVYQQVAQLDALNEGDEPVAIYRNLLFDGMNPRRQAPPYATSAGLAHRASMLDEYVQVELWKCLPRKAVANDVPRPDVSLRPSQRTARLLWATTLPALGLYALALAATAIWRRRRPVAP